MIFEETNPCFENFKNKKGPSEPAKKQTDGYPKWNMQSISTSYGNQSNG